MYNALHIRGSEEIQKQAARLEYLVVVPWVAAGPVAVPVSGGNARLRCRWVASRPGCGARGRWRVLAGPTHQMPPVWRAPEGPEGTGGLRDAAPSEARSPSLAGGRGLRRLENPWSQEQYATSCWAAAHRHTQRPGRARRALRYAERLGPAVRTAVAASSVGGRQIQGFDGGLEGGGGLLVLVRVGVFLDLARQDAGGRGLVVR